MVSNQHNGNDVEQLETNKHYILLTESEIYIYLKKRSGNTPVFKEELRGINDFKLINKRYRNYIYFAICFLFSFIFFLVLAYGVITLDSLTPIIETVSEVPGPATELITVLLQTAIAGISIITILLITISIACIVLAGLFIKKYFKSTQEYIVINRKYGPKYYVPVESKETSSTTVSRLEEIHSQLK